MSLTLKTAPDSLDELMLQSVCDHLRRIAALDESPVIAPDDLDHIRALNVAAVELMDGPISKTRRSLLTQTWIATFDYFSREMPLRLAPVQSVSSVKYIDQDGAEQTVSSALYRLYGADSWDPVVAPIFGETWPETQSTVEAVTIEFVAGYGDGLEDVPAPILHAVRMLVAHWYENREAIDFNTPHEIPLGVATLIQPYRIFR